MSIRSNLLNHDAAPAEFSSQHALIVVAHPDAQSFTHAVAAQVGESLVQSGAGRSFEIADLAAEGFDPRFTATDNAIFHKRTPLSADIAAEQARIDRADALVLVYPVYWWSMPALLKGWIDRVFSNGWAYEEDENLKVTKRLGRLDVHLLAVGGSDLRTYARHGYFGAMKTQIDHGIFEYCGARVLTSELLAGSQTQDGAANLETARAVGRKLFRPAATREAAAA